LRRTAAAFFADDAVPLPLMLLDEDGADFVVTGVEGVGTEEDDDADAGVLRSAITAAAAGVAASKSLSSSSLSSSSSSLEVVAVVAVACVAEGRALRADPLGRMSASLLNVIIRIPFLIPDRRFHRPNRCSSPTAIEADHTIINNQMLCINDGEQRKEDELLTSNEEFARRSKREPINKTFYWY
jgi:hypothetical protein